MKYAVIFEQTQNNWAAYVPDLPGCTATGKTLEETRSTVIEALKSQLERMKLLGEAIPEPTTVAGVIEVKVRHPRPD